MKHRSIGAAAGLALFAAAFAGAAQAQNVNTTVAANATFCTLGPGGANTIGQTFVVPAGSSSVTNFGIEVQIPATMIVRGELWAWDTGTQRPTGAALYTSAPTSSTGLAEQLLSFTPGAAVSVTPGQTYVIFLTTVRDAGAGDGCLTHTGTDASIVPGSIHYQFSAVPADFTASGWAFGGVDAGVTINYAAPATVPTMSEWALILFGLMLAGGAAMMVQRGRLTA